MKCYLIRVVYNSQIINLISCNIYVRFLCVYNVCIYVAVAFRFLGFVQVKEPLSTSLLTN